MKYSNLIGKKAYIIDKDSFYYNEWGIIKDFDGEYFYIAIANDINSMPIFTRDEIRIHRK